MSEPLSLEEFVDLSQCLHGGFFRGTSPFECVGKNLSSRLARLLDEAGAVGEAPLVEGDVADGAYLRGRVFVAEGAVVEPTAYIEGPAYIGPRAQVRHGAYVRGYVYAGPHTVIGHATEIKGAVLFDGAKAAHFAYVGDAVLGRDVNLGAGTKLANLPLQRREIRVLHPHTGKPVSTGLDKLSAIMGDHSQTGCNAVLSPGTLLLPEAGVMPCVHFRGTLQRGERKS